MRERQKNAAGRWVPVSRRPQVADPALAAAIADEVASRRAALGMSSDDLARRGGLPGGTTIRSLESRGRNPTLGTLAAVARGLGCSLTTLIDAAEMRVRGER